jgi:hypothetical protein
LARRTGGRNRASGSRQRIDTPKSVASERTIQLSQTIADELFEHRDRTTYDGDDDRVFCSTTKGTPFDFNRYAVTLRLALARAGIEGRVRPFHDMRKLAERLWGQTGRKSRYEVPSDAVAPTETRA